MTYTKKPAKDDLVISSDLRTAIKSCIGCMYFTEDLECINMDIYECILTDSIFMKLNDSLFINSYNKKIKYYEGN